jgi:hypothetical protein
MSNLDNALEQLKILKGMTLRTGIIHDAQMLQLEMYPLVVFDAISSVLNIDTDKRYIKMVVSVNKLPKSQDLLQNEDLIRGWVRSILWDDSSVDFEYRMVKDVSSRANSKRAGRKPAKRRR